MAGLYPITSAAQLSFGRLFFAAKEKPARSAGALGLYRISVNRCGEKPR